MANISIRVNLLRDIENELFFKKLGLTLSKSKDSLFVYITIAEYDVVPEEFLKYVTVYTIREIFYNSQPRISGFYKLDTATARVSCSLDSSSKYYWVSTDIYGKSLKDVLGLFYQIRAGKILPAESWDELQITKNQVLKELKEKFRKLSFFKKTKKFLDYFYNKLSRK